MITNLVVSDDIAYFLHAKPHRDNSALVYLLTRKHGKVSFIVSGLKSKNTNKRALLQPCKLLTVNYQLKSNLSKLLDIEISPNHENISPPISYFMIYQYVNELFLAIFPSQHANSVIFDEYTHFLSQLNKKRPHAGLRILEIAILLQFSGLPALHTTADTQKSINQENTYFYYLEHGIYETRQSGMGLKISGQKIIAFRYIVSCYEKNELSKIDETIAQGAKPMTAFLIAQLLNGKRLRTRDIYQDLTTYLLG